MDETCTKDTVFTFLCNCDECCREAAGAWCGYMDRVKTGDITLDEANRLADTHPQIAPRC